jgi:hypothetical protein
VSTTAATTAGTGADVRGGNSRGGDDVIGVDAMAGAVGMNHEAVTGGSVVGDCAVGVSGDGGVGVGVGDVG